MTETAIFAGGCFWCTESIFQNLRGVSLVLPGYTGGTTKNPTWQNVYSGKTGHAEAVKIEFEPKEISYKTLLDVFFATHDPTSLNQQGADKGTEYRSAIFPATSEQEKIAEDKIKVLNASGEYDSPIVTTIERFAEFFPAEDYHLNYYESHKDAPYCQIVINPKLAKLRSKFGKLLKS
jgi:peptide-methionine (S)-S-oxide reductase